MAKSTVAGHCQKPHHRRTCAFCFFLCILLNPRLVYSEANDGVRTTLPTNTGVNNDNLQENSETPISFIKRLFVKYGQNGTMTFEAFEHLLHSLGLVKSIRIENHVISHDLSAHLHNGKFQNIHDHDSSNHQTAEDLYEDYFGRMEDYDHVDHSDKQEHLHGNQENYESETHGAAARDSPHRQDEKHQPHTDHDQQITPATSNPTRSPETRSKRSYPNCMSTTDILKTLNLTRDLPITEKDFVNLCPILIYQIDKHTCDESDRGHLHDDHSLHDHGGSDHHGNDTEGGYGSVKLLNAPLIVWGYALLSVFVISLVGLLGVAIVPVMQKVFYNHLLQFLVALAVGSLTGDAFLHLLPHSLLPHDTHDDHQGGHSKQGIYKGLVAFAGVYFFFLTERIMGIVTEWRRRINREKNKKVTEATTSPKLLPDLADQETEMGYKLTQRGDGNCEERMMMVHPSKDLRNMAEDMHEHIHRDCGKDDNKRISHSHGGAGHNHGHGHSHDVPDSVASVAWMVIMGDGLHNFSDGLAIGAAFANSLSGGLSTSIAVFCHELPHELGDFAMLLRAGMSVRQALVYNCVSSILCVVGMVVGVAAGNIESVSLWIFALAGGMFIYIALVDMLPEMINNSPKHGENPVWHLILQNFGILIGSGVMLVIALYEDKIMVPDVFP